MKFVGQEKLLATIDSYTASTFPKTLMLIGEEGCGKHTVARKIAEKFNLEFSELKSETTIEELTDKVQTAIPTLYFINLANFPEKQQNRFLKFIEEPSIYAYVILSTESEIGVLPTILNRCIKLRFEPYTVEQLKEINWMHDESELLFAVCNTPGKLMSLGNNELEGVAALCDKIVHKIDIAKWANTLKIATEINYKEDYNKFTFDLFLDTLEYMAYESYKTEKSDLALKVYQITNRAKSSKINKNIVKENFMISFLTTLWKETRNDPSRA